MRTSSPIHTQLSIVYDHGVAPVRERRYLVAPHLEKLQAKPGIRQCGEPHTGRKVNAQPGTEAAATRKGVIVTLVREQMVHSANST